MTVTSTRWRCSMRCTGLLPHPAGRYLPNCTVTQTRPRPAISGSTPTAIQSTRRKSFSPPVSATWRWRRCWAQRAGAAATRPDPGHRAHHPRLAAAARQYQADPGRHDHSRQQRGGGRLRYWPGPGGDAHDCRSRRPDLSVANENCRSCGPGRRSASCRRTVCRSTTNPSATPAHLPRTATAGSPWPGRTPISSRRWWHQARSTQSWRRSRRSVSMFRLRPDAAPPGTIR